MRVFCCLGATMQAVYKVIQPEIKVGDDGVITATLSTEAEDRDGDIIRAAGWQLGDFNKHPVLLSSHDYRSLRSQIGEWKNVRVEDSNLIGEPHYYSGQGNDEADWAEKLAKMGKAAYSVGFIPIDSNPRKGFFGNQEFVSQELLECSHVSIPSNREALQLMAKSVKGPIADIAHDLLHKWPMDDTFAKLGWAQHCIVPGCDDAMMVNVPICPEHLKYLMNAPAEPPGSPPDDDDLTVGDGGSAQSYGSGAMILDAFTHWATKAGARNSASDAAMIQAIHDHAGKLGAEASDACGANSSSESDAATPPTVKTPETFDLAAAVEAELSKHWEAV